MAHADRRPAVLHPGVGRTAATSRDLLPGFLIIGVGIGFSFVPISIAALAGVKPAEAGLASGLINTSQQIGGALGIAALSTIATSQTEDSVAQRVGPAGRRWSTGSQSAFLVGAIVAALGRGRGADPDPPRRAGGGDCRPSCGGGGARRRLSRAAYRRRGAGPGGPAPLRCSRVRSTAGRSRRPAPGRAAAGGR